jgi:hypothetical protein
VGGLQRPEAGEPSMDRWVAEEQALRLRAEPPVVPREGRLWASVVFIRLLLPRVSNREDRGLLDCEMGMSWAETRPEFVAVRVWPELENRGEGPGERSGGVVGGDTGSPGDVCCDFLSRGDAMAKLRSDGAAEPKGDLAPEGGDASCDPCFPVVDRDLASDFA